MSFYALPLYWREKRERNPGLSHQIKLILRDFIILATDFHRIGYKTATFGTFLDEIDTFL